ncbi:hypothetical protein LL240_12160 [Oceanimonas baumannii]|uniref:hypothetical protein n=1 Tax=Oceanimonas baumannii TaxID=129578 RepID=UPI001D1848CC|nr:hypothetical protein [Oceanimonas baumannii]MCC4265198.1 hypothetical protein [Oceanimonas baumannii]
MMKPGKWLLTGIWLTACGAVQAGVAPGPDAGVSPPGQRMPGSVPIGLSAVTHALKHFQLLTVAETGVAPRLLRSRHGRGLLHNGEQAYVRGRLHLGQQYGVYRDMGGLVDERTQTHYGHRIMLTGMVTAGAQLQPELTGVAINRLSRDIRAGDLLLPWSAGEEPPVVYHAVPGPALADGRVLAIGHEGSVAVPHDVVWLNKGRRDGVREGHLYGVFRPADELPPLAVARVMLIQTGEYASAALVIGSRETVRAGDELGEPEYDELSF